MLSPAQDLTDTAVADPQLTGDVAGSDAGVSQLYNLGADDVRQWTAVDKHTAELVHPSMACGDRKQRMEIIEC